ncbi:MAG TPA: ribbon-helix-helix domain-containing protein [Candidatus Sulfotelmatobacter sp.]|jgi:predicted DNA-binding protein
MSNTLTVRLPEELQQRLRERSRRTGLPIGRIIRDSLENTLSKDEPAWMKYAGTFTGLRNLSSRKGYSRS